MKIIKGSINNVGGGTIGGSVAADQVAYGSGVNTINGSNDLTWDNGTKLLAVNGDLTVSNRIAVGSDAVLANDQFYDFSTTITDFTGGPIWNVFNEVITIDSSNNYAGNITIENQSYIISGSKNYNFIAGSGPFITNNGSGTFNAIFGGGAGATNSGSAAISQQDGWDVISYIDGSGTIGTNIGLYVLTGAFSGSVTGQDYSIFISSPATGGTAGSHYGLYIDNQSGLAPDLDTYSIYTLGGAKHYFGGSVGLGAGGPVSAQAPRGSLEVGSRSGDTIFSLSNDACLQPFTSEVPTDIFSLFVSSSPTNGGLILTALSGSDVEGFFLKGCIGSTTPTVPAISFFAFKTDGGTGVASIGASEISVRFGNKSSPSIDILGNNTLKLYGGLSHATGNIGFFGTSAGQQTGGAATAGALYTATEQGMLQKAYDCLRTFGFLT